MPEKHPKHALNISEDSLEPSEAQNDTRPHTQEGLPGKTLSRGKHAKLGSVDKNPAQIEEDSVRIEENPARIEEAKQPSGNTLAASIGSSAALISICVIVSRVTGFLRTWAMAFALGATMLSSSYQVANNLPNMLYELVVGGMLVTAFLPVYLSVKKNLGEKASNDYASNLFTIVIVLLGIMSLFCMAFPSLVIYTQSFFSSQEEMGTAVFFFQYFAIQIVFYGMSSILSGLLNANRDYLWSSIAPVANNVIVISTFLAYAFIAPRAPDLALYVIAVGNPLGVLVQVLIQVPALKKNGIRLRLRLNLHDPALRDTIGLGVPALFVMLCSFAVVSVQNASAYSFADNGPSILAYSRLWFTLPYAFLAIPITTAMFTELAEMFAENNIDGVKSGILDGSKQILFFMVPFALYLIVFSGPLVTLYHAGAFTADNITQIATYLSALAFALPFYGVNTYLQKVYSSLRKMGSFALLNLIACIVQIALSAGAALAYQHGFGSIELLALIEMLFYLIADFIMFAFLKRHLGNFPIGGLVKTFFKAALYGALGAAAGFGVESLLLFAGLPVTSSIPFALICLAAGGLLSLAITFGLALWRKEPEAAFIGNLLGKVTGKLSR